MMAWLRDWTAILPPPHLSAYNTVFYYRDDDGVVYGPLSVPELALIEIGPEADISPGSPDFWQPASLVPGLMEAVAELSSGACPDGGNDELHEIIARQEGELRQKDQEMARLREESRRNEELRREREMEAERQNAERLRRVHFNETMREMADIESAIARYSLAGAFDAPSYSDIHDRVAVIAATLSQSGDDAYDATQRSQIVSSMRHMLMLMREMAGVDESASYALAPVRSRLWQQVAGDSEPSPSPLVTACRDMSDFTIFGETVGIDRYHMLNMLGPRNIFMRYDSRTSAACQAFIATVLSRQLMVNEPGRFVVNVVDCVDMDGVSASLKRLAPIYGVVSQPADIHRLLENEVRHIEDVIQNLLVYPVKDLVAYNEGRTSPEPYRYIVVKAFPVGLNGDDVDMIRNIARNGPRAGVHLLLAYSEDEMLRSPRAQVLMEDFDHSDYITFDLVDNLYPCTIRQPGVVQHVTLSTLSEERVADIAGVIGHRME